MRKPIDKLAVGIMLILCPIWGLQQVAIKAVALDVPPAFQVTLRSAVAAALVLLLSRFAKREQWLLHTGLKAGIAIGACFAAEFLLVAEGLRWTSAAHMSMFLYTSPVFVAVGLHFRLPEERLNRLQWSGVLLAFIGVIVTFLQSSESAGASRLWILGDLMGIAAAIAWALRTITVRSSSLSEAPPTQTLFYQLFFASIIMFTFSSVSGQVSFNGTGLAWASLGFQILVVSVAAYLAWFWMLRRYFAAPLSVLTFITPVFGVAMGVVLLGEKITMSFIIGAGMVLAGVLLVTGQGWIRARFSARA